MPMALTLYMHPLSSYCQKVLIALYENEVAFEPKMVDFADPEARAAFVALWPTGKIPLLHDAARGKVVPETSIMIEYLDTHYSGGQPMLPADPDARLDARLWDRLLDCYVMTPMQRIVANQLRPEAERDARGATEARALLAMAYGMLERQLADRPWMTGTAFTIADCAAAPSLFYAGIIEPFPGEHVHLAAYFERLIRRPSVARTLEEARPYFAFFPFKELMPERFLSR
jgi:glutathione S-transferase